MYRLMIVDDDKTIRQNMIQLIEWQNCPFCLTEEAYNGQDALEKMRKNPVDLIITDVMMPIMDGIELITRVQEEFPDVVFVVLSNYDDFSYVKSALKIGALDYLLKFENTKENLCALLENAKQEIERRSDRKKQSRRETLRRKATYLEKVISHKQEFPQELPEFLAKDMQGVLIGARSSGDGEMLQQSMERLLRLLTLPKEGFCFLGEENEQFLFLNYESTVSVQDALIEIMKELNWNHGLWNSSRYSLAVETVLLSAETFFHGLQHCRRMLKAIFYEPGLRLVTARNFIPFVHAESLDSYLSSVGDIIKSLQKGRREEMEQKLFDLCVHMESDRLDTEQAHLVWEHLTHELNDLCLSFEVRPSERFENGLIPSDFSKRFWDLQEIRQAFIQLIRSIDFGSGIRQDEIPNQIVSDAVGYMKKHYAESVGLQEVSDAVGVSKTHLCRLFKQHAGESFNKILNDIRISRAKQLLINSNLSIADISYEVGFSDYRYFKKVFIDFTGVFPTEYRMKQK